MALKEPPKDNKKTRKKTELLELIKFYPDYLDQIGRGLGENLLKAGIHLSSKAIGSDTGKKNNQQGNRQYTKYI